MDDAARARVVAPGPTGAGAASKPSRQRSYAGGARVLSVGIAATGLLTFAYFSIASHVLSAVAAKRIDLLWSVMFVIISVIYRPIEQLLSRTIASRRALGAQRHPLRVPITIQAAFALAFLAIALALRGTVTNHVFDRYAALYWVLVVGTLAYAASYFARGWLAGHQHFALYGGLVLLESLSRLAFALAVAVSIAHGQTAVALGIAAAPFVSLIVVPWAFATRARTHRGPSLDAAPVTVADADAAVQGPAAEAVEEAARDLSMRRGTGFAFSVAAIMLAEQTLLNAAVLTVDATAASRLLAGIVFNVLLIARAPLQLFQSIQTTLLPHLAGLEATAGRAAFARAVRVTVLAIAAFALLVAIALLAAGPFAMSHLFGQHFRYGRVGLAVVGLGMGLHLCAGALNQAALARGQTTAAATAWIGAAALFVGWLFIPAVGNELLRVELGYFGAAGVLTLALWALYRLGNGRKRAAVATAAP
jgi:O-antigen/teichoic acid export membrane protein